VDGYAAWQFAYHARSSPLAMRLDVDCVYRAVHLRRVLGAHEWPCAL